MHSDQAPYRKLLDQIDGCDNGSLNAIIEQWLTTQSNELAWFEALARVWGDDIPTISNEDSWRLYALSRVSDALIKLIGENHSRVDHYTKFMERLGLRRINTPSYHPFYHEIVSVSPSAITDAPIALSGLVWPGFMCGSLMITRAGVSVTGGDLHIKKKIAETSTLYWSYRRAGRPTEDLSLGWGSNSEWRTRFRRDYCNGGQFHYNVDGSNDAGEPTLKECERLELLRHRCFILTDQPHSNLFPYELRHKEPIA